MNHEQILDLITTRQAVATTHAQQLREQIAALTDQLALVDAELAELATTRNTLLRLTGTTTSSTAATDTVASPAYQQILTVFTTTSTPLRAKDICIALGTGTAAKNTEGIRAKLKRLVARGVLTEPGAGLFALAQPTTSNPDPTPQTEQT